MFVIVNLIVVLSLHTVVGLNILGIFPAPSFSHQSVFQPVFKELSLRGHHVTAITPNPLNDPKLLNLTEIDVSFSYDIMVEHNFIQTISGDKSTFDQVMGLYNVGLFVNEAQIQTEAVQKLLNDHDLNYDLIIIQVTHNFNLISLGFGGRFKVPMIAISSLEVFLHSHDAMGNPTHPIVSPDMMLSFSEELQFFDKVKSLLYNFWYRMVYYWYALPKSDRIARKYFGDDIPYLGDIEKNISLMLVNVNPIIHNARPNVPNVIEINQMHIKEPKPLPLDLQKYLDSSKQGVVYFSLGSNVKSANLTNKIRNEIITALKELPYNVLWKWETDYLPDQPDNVMIRKWFPQQDVLRHPNVKVFVTQGGLQSIEEAIMFEVPMVGIPFITDQPTNIKKIIKLGLGLGINYRTFTKDDIKNAIIEVVTNKKYKEAVKKSRAILVDQPMKGVEKAVWWIEYVIRHKGAKHLRSPAADMSFYEYFMIDIVLFLLLCIAISLYLTYKSIIIIRTLISTKALKLKSH